MKYLEERTASLKKIREDEAKARQEEIELRRIEVKQQQQMQQ